MIVVTDSGLLKAHVHAHTKKDGTVVKDYERQGSLFRIKHTDTGKIKKLSTQPHQKIVAPQYGMGGGSFLFHTLPKAPPKVYHPKNGDNGKPVGIYNPNHQTSPDTWHDPKKTATFIPGGACPDELNGLALSPWLDHPKTDEEWDYVEGQMEDLDEPVMKLKQGLKPASGCIIKEPDGRVWLVSPTNQFGGYCVPQDSSEILTRSGWKKHNEVVVGDETIGFNVEKCVSEWTPVLAVHHYDSLPMVRFGGGKWSVRCTKDHKWLARMLPNPVKNKTDRIIGDAHWDVINRRHAEKQEERINKEYLMMRTCNVSGASRLIVRAAPHVTDDESDITPREAAIIAWIITDGHITKSRHGNVVSAAITQAKKSGVDELDKLLADTKHEKYDKRSFDGCYHYYFPAIVFRGILDRTGWDGKKESIPGLVLRMSNAAVEAFLHACWVAEGDENRETRLWQNDGPVQDAMVIAGYRLGSAPVVSGKKKCKSISMTLATRLSYKSHVVEDGESPAWCVTTGLGTWTMRQGGVVTLTGNSNTFPKGKVEDEMSWQANAIKEVFEESGLKVKIVGYAGDVDRTTSVTRYYHAVRVGGTPADVGWESQAVHLIPASDLHLHLDGAADHEVIGKADLA